MSRHRTKLEAEADALDCAIDGLVRRIERMADNFPAARSRILEAARKVDSARSNIRTLMHQSDRAATQ